MGLGFLEVLELPYYLQAFPHPGEPIVTHHRYLVPPWDLPYRHPAPKPLTIVEVAAIPLAHGPPPQ